MVHKNQIDNYIITRYEWMRVMSVSNYKNENTPTKQVKAKKLFNNNNKY